MGLQDAVHTSVSNIFDSLVPLSDSDASDDAPQGYTPPPTAHLQPITQSRQPPVVTRMPHVYIKGTQHLGLLHKADSSLIMHGFIDSDWAGCYDTRRSHSGNCFMLGSSCISWVSKKQATVATSSCEAEYRPAFTTTVECVWQGNYL